MSLFRKIGRTFKDVLTFSPLGETFDALQPPEPPDSPDSPEPDRRGNASALSLMRQRQARARGRAETILTGEDQQRRRRRRTLGASDALLGGPG